MLLLIRRRSLFSINGSLRVTPSPRTVERTRECYEGKDESHWGDSDACGFEAGMQSNPNTTASRVLAGVGLEMQGADTVVVDAYVHVAYEVPFVWNTFRL
uniref:Uncharacterized protein n=1 Tax=Mycena chlorophos TaxID=658473 RepID=A0ABQ0KW02_MYCCL|nr:predicted protein [Mycena chlorophos]